MIISYSKTRASKLILLLFLLLVVLLFVTTYFKYVVAQDYTVCTLDDYELCYPGGEGLEEYEEEV